MAGGRQVERLAQVHFVPLSKKLIEVIERGVRGREFRAVDSHHVAVSLVALSAFYFAPDPVVRVVSHVDPYDKFNLARRKEEVLKFMRYGPFRNPGAHLP